ncbi:MAG TPA: hypothetical protein VIW92_12030 [Thermoanaerobaculia bacterium]
MKTTGSRATLANLINIASTLVMVVALSLSSPAEASVYGPAPYFDNLLTNPNGDAGNLSGWTLTANGGDGWAVDTGYHQNETADNGFLTSYEWAQREQIVDLLSQGFTPDLLEAQPPIIISETFEKVFCADHFFVEVDLLDSSMNLIRTWTSGRLSHSSTNCDYSGYKEQVNTELTHYGTGVRYIRWRDGGKDS